MSVTVPGNNPYVITVGAFTDNYTPDDWNDDYITPFSSAGPTLDGFVKPDVIAPGAHIVSTMLPGSYIARHHTANWVNGLYYSMAGTSQAAAVVSGIAALVISEHPELTPNEVKYRITSTAFPWVTADQSGFLYSMWQQGSGRVNAPDAVFADIQGEANAGMDINADLNGDIHYEGYSYFDETTGQFKLRGDYNAYESAYGTWSGAYGTWSGAYGTWSGAYGTWSGAYGTWSGAVGPWAGAYGTWSGAYGTWSGAYGTWSGAYGTWSGGYQNWDGTNNQWAGAYSNPEFAEKFVEGSYAGQGTPYTGQHNFVGSWVEEE
jgi:serine protease AprX